MEIPKRIGTVLIGMAGQMKKDIAMNGKGGPMVILDECWQYGDTALGFVSIFFVIFGIVVIVGALAMFDEWSIITAVWVITVSLGLIIGGVIGAYRTRQKEYKVFLQDMTLEEFETEYEPINFEGLIIKARRKEN